LEAPLPAGVLQEFPSLEAALSPALVPCAFFGVGVLALLALVFLLHHQQFHLPFARDYELQKYFSKAMFLILRRLKHHRLH
jgi:hypothetical protein